MRVFLPFVVGYYLSYLFRTINALIAAPLTSELGLGADDLGLLTSVYFLTFGVAQIPIGILLDRYEPRRIQSALLVAAALGAALFAASDSFVLLLLGRALIGLGVAASLTAGLKALVLWFPKERLSLLNGLMIMLGALGAVTATAPAELLLAWIGWRELFGLFAVMTAGCAVAIYLVVPEIGSVATIASGGARAGFRTVYADPRFCAWRRCRRRPLERLGRYRDCGQRSGLPMWRSSIELRWSVICLSWPSPSASARCCWEFWQIDCVGAGIGPETLLGIIAALFITVQLALILRLPAPSYLLWSVVRRLARGQC